MSAVSRSLDSESCSERPIVAWITPRPESSIMWTSGLEVRRDWTTDLRRKLQARDRAEARHDSFCENIRGLVFKGVEVWVRCPRYLSIRETESAKTGVN